MKVDGKILVRVTNEDIIDGTFIVPDYIEKIGWEAFRGCTSLTHIVLPEGLEEIESGVFFGCTSLTHITLPEGVVRIGDGVFQGCISLTHITLPEGLKWIGDGAFDDCTSLAHLVLPEGLKWIGWRAFEDCTSLTHITFPNGLEWIGWYAFRGCTSLTHITFPNGKVYSHRCVDGYPFLIENTRQVGNTAILKGIWLDVYEDGEILGNNCFVAERDNFTAHGETIREAMDDLELKIAQDKLQNEPLSMDDEIDVTHYRAITGACKMGVAKWMQDNKVSQEKILVRDLLPMLEKTNAYGLEKFKKLIK